MTKRLYYFDSHTTEFSARVVERLSVRELAAVILDCTYFYPIGGGQPCDTGVINEVAVTDVFTRDEDAKIIHVLDREVEKDEVFCRLNWDRRLDHMQHHTGQHILTQAFVQVAGANTVSFHLTSDSVTIDLDTTNISQDTLIQVEDLVNQIVLENRPVTVRLIDPNEADGVRIRRIPEHLYTDGLRVIEVEGFDTTACGGTHVARTGEIGMIKIIKCEKRGDKTRVEFRCGMRALHDYRQKNIAVNQLSADLTCSSDELVQIVTGLRDSLKQSQRDLKTLTNQLIDYEAERLLKTAVKHKDESLIKAVFVDRELNVIRELVNRLIQFPNVIAIIGIPGEKAQIILACNLSLPYDMTSLLKQILPYLGHGRGGGRPNFAQGGGIKADIGQIEAVLNEVERIILSMD